MKALTLNLASRPFRNNTVIGSVLAAVTITLVLSSVYSLYIFFSYGSSYALLLEDQERNRAKLAALEVEERRLLREIERRDFDTTFDRGRFANDLIIRRTFSWTELFNKLEGVMPIDVMMAAIRPNVTADGVVIRVEGGARNQGAFIQLQDNLMSHASFSNVYPASERRLNPSRPETSFILNFDYRPRTFEAAEVIADTPEIAPPEPAAASATTTGSAVVPAAVTAATGGGGFASTLPVGRDGEPRTLELIARRMVAPGGVFAPDISTAAAARTGSSGSTTAGKPDTAKRAAPRPSPRAPASSSGSPPRRPEPPLPENLPRPPVPRRPPPQRPRAPAPGSRPIQGSRPPRRGRQSPGGTVPRLRPPELPSRRPPCGAAASPPLRSIPGEAGAP